MDRGTQGPHRPSDTACGLPDRVSPARLLLTNALPFTDPAGSL
uniref:ZDHHC8 protein n=1 Tax=Homo sapiens TaxID=9606 RepID=Q96GI9_HUMAN